jgi:predicted butyrate kinase (DUF1464 family)
VTVVLYHMFEAYVEIEEANLVAADIAKGFASFIVVAGGGTVIGIVWGYVTGFVTRFARSVSGRFRTVSVCKIRILIQERSVFLHKWIIFA